MIGTRLDHAVARATGETLATIRQIGFHELPDRPAGDLAPEDLALAVACPFCRRDTPLEAGAGVLPALGACDRCDVFFDYLPEEVEVVARAVGGVAEAA